MPRKPAETMRVVARSLPVLAEGDVIVTGAGFGGCAIAHSLAMRGYRVILVESRIFPGWEVSALLRPWVDSGVLRNTPRIMSPWLKRAAVPTAGRTEISLRPGVMKRGLEDALLARGVRLIYGYTPVGTVHEGGRLSGVVVAGKGGRYALVGRSVVDATEWGLVARLAGEDFKERALSPSIVSAYRTLEFTGLIGGTDAVHGAEPVVASTGGGASLISVHQGCLGSRHVLVEVGWKIQLPSSDLEGLMAVEIGGRKGTVSVVESLRKSFARFRKAYFASASLEMRMESPLVMTSQVARTPNLFVLSSALGESEKAPDWFDPAAVARAGESLARQVASSVGRQPRVRQGACKARCGSIDSRSKRGVYAREPVPPARMVVAGRVASREERVPILAETDVVVVGGGTSGSVAAPVAASIGVKTVLLEMNQGLGGTGTLGGVNTYWYGRKNGFTEQVDRRYRSCARLLGATSKEMDELSKTPEGGKWHVEGKMQALLEWSLEEGVQVYFRTMVVGTFVDKGAVVGLLVATPDGLSAVRCRTVVEATGDGDVPAFGRAKFTRGSARDGVPMYASLGPVASPGHPTNSFAGWIEAGDPDDLTRGVLAGRRRFTWYDHGPYLAPRETRHVIGGYVVTLRDQLAFRRYRDVVCTCYDGRDIKGITSADWALWGISVGKISVEIPWRALVPERLDGVLVTGKAYSCTHEGLALPRMQADMQNLGGVVGLAAGMSILRGVIPRKLDVRALQHELVRRRVLPRSILSRHPVPPINPDKLGSIVRGLRGNELRYPGNYWEIPRIRPDDISIICDSKSRVALPIIRKEHRKSVGERRLLLARLLAWHGSGEGCDDILERINRELGKTGLPAIPGPRTEGHPAPDNAAMPGMLRLVYTMGLARDSRVLDVIRRIVARFHPGRGEFRYPRPAYYLYTQVICLVAERMGDPRAIPVLEKLHSRRGLHGLVTRRFQPDIMDERMGYLEVAIGRAMARCGSAKGIRILSGYLADARAVLANHAHDELVDVTGMDKGWEPSAWLSWVRRWGKTMEAHPWRGRSETV